MFPDIAITFLHADSILQTEETGKPILIWVKPDVPRQTQL